MEDEAEEKDIYNIEKREEMLDNDEIDSEEEGFMRGYDKWRNWKWQ